jgi:hypothetical protein
MPMFQDISLTFAVKWIELSLCIWDILGLNLYLETNIIDSYFLGFPWSLQADAEVVHI